MNRTRLLGWVLIILLVMVWQFSALKKAQQEEEARKKRQADSLAALVHEKGSEESATGETPRKADSQTSKAKSAESGEATPSTGSEAANSEEKVAEAQDSLQEATRAAPVRQITVQTNHFVVNFSSIGGKVESLVLRKMKGERGPQPEVLIPPESGGALGITLGDYKLSEHTWFAGADADTIKVEKEPFSLEFSLNIEGHSLRRTYTFFPDSQSFQHQFDPGGLDESFTLDWLAGLRETEEMPTGKGWGLNYGYFTEVVFDNGIVSRENFTGSKSFNEESGILRWVGLRRKYVAAMVDFGRDVEYRLKAVALDDEPDAPNGIHSYQVFIKGHGIGKTSLNFEFVVLPLWHDQVLAYNKNYEKIIFTGYSWFLGADVWYPKLCGLVLGLLKFFHNLIPNYGIAIILLTLLVRVILLPLTISQTRAMNKMQEHMPAIKEIREKYKGNPQKVNQETMAYYKKVGVNPLAQMTGCFPIFLQFPVFIALFNVLGRALELKNEPFFLWVSDLSRPDVLVSGFQVPYLFPMGLTVLPFAMAGTMYFQTKMTITDPNQKAMVYMMPIMMFLFSASFPSGLVLYWTVSNVFTIGQTAIMKRKKGAAPQPVTAKPVNLSKKKRQKSLKKA